MAFTVEGMLNQARLWIGTAEQPLGSNHVPGITDWYPPDTAWCNKGLSRCATDAGLAHRCAWVPGEITNAQNGYQGWRWIDDPTAGQPGDWPCYYWGSSGLSADHIEIVEAVVDGGYVTIGFNVADRCLRLNRSYANIVGFVRPPYEETSDPIPDPEPTPVPPQEEEVKATYVVLIDPDLPSVGGKPQFVDGRVWFAGAFAPRHVEDFGTQEDVAARLGIEIVAAPTGGAVAITDGRGATRDVWAVRKSDAQVFGLDPTDKP